MTQLEVQLPISTVLTFAVTNYDCGVLASCVFSCILSFDNWKKQIDTVKFLKNWLVIPLTNSNKPIKCTVKSLRNHAISKSFDVLNVRTTFKTSHEPLTYIQLRICVYYGNVSGDFFFDLTKFRIYGFYWNTIHWRYFKTIWCS